LIFGYPVLGTDHGIEISGFSEWSFPPIGDRQMSHSKSTSRLNITNALLMSLAMGTVGMPMAMAADVNASAAADKKTTAYEESETPVSDTWITTKVKADLLVTEEVKGLDINVSTTNGVVTLAGVLDSKAQHDKAIAVAKAIKGVKSVESKALKLKPAK